MINHKQMEALMTVVREGNITRAAKKLYISQPALSQMILGIERELGTPLFDRSTIPMRLTYAGEKYLSACSQIHRIYDTVTQQISEIHDGSLGRITLGMSLHQSIIMTHRILPRFFAVYPKYDLKLVEIPSHHLAEMALSGQVDLAVVYRPLLSGLTYKPVNKETIYLAVPPFFYQCLPHYNIGVNNRALHINDLRNEPFILLKKGHGIRTIADRLFENCHYSPRILLETESIDVAHQLTKENLGFAFVPSSIIHTDHFLNKKGVYFPIADGISQREIFVCYRKDNYHSPALNALVEIIADTVQIP